MPPARNRVSRRKSRPSTGLKRRKRFGANSRLISITHSQPSSNIMSELVQDARWDPLETTEKNYLRTNLSADVNADIVPSRTSRHTQQNVVRPVVQWVPGPEPEKKPITISADDLAYISRLIAKHGDDVDGMFRDIKLNVQQLSKGELKKMMEKKRIAEAEA